MSNMKNLDRDTVVTLMSAIGARANDQIDMQENRDYYCKLYYKYSKWVEALKVQLEEQGIEPVRCPQQND